MSDNPFVGPYRVAPGRLSVSRTFGDLEAKIPELGGMPGVVVCDPDITYMKGGTKELDFIILGSDGIFDKLNNETIGKLVWSTIKECSLDPTISIHKICGICTDLILKEAAKNKSIDNISIVMIAFQRLHDYITRARAQIEHEVDP